jgi:hypothetical protein
MKNLKIYFLLFFAVSALSLGSCKKTTVSDFIAKNCLRPKEVRENGAIVYTHGGANNTKPAYSKFKIVFNLPDNGVELTETDGTISKGKWVFNDPKISLSGLNPALTDAAAGTNTRTTAEYQVVTYDAKAKTLTVTALTKNLKVGDVSVQYTLVPCE